MEIKKKYNSEIIHFKSENINNIVLLKKLFEDLELKYKEITIQKKLNTNLSSGYSETIISDFFLSKFENFKKKIPEKIKEKVPEFLIMTDYKIIISNDKNGIFLRKIIFQFSIM